MAQCPRVDYRNTWYNAVGQVDNLPHGPTAPLTTSSGPERTPCFRVRQSHLRGPVTKAENTAHIVIVTDGACQASAGGETHHLRPYDKFFCPAGLGPVNFQPAPTATLLECYPPIPE